MTARKTVKTAPAEVAWFVTGRGKTGKYYAAVPSGIMPREGDAVALVAKTGAITYGTLNAPATDLDAKASARIPEGVAVWTFTRDNARMTPELRAENAAKKAEARAEFLRSPAGIAQAERIAANAVKKAEAEAAGMPDTKTVTVSRIMEAPATEAPAADGPTLAEQAEALKAVGFTAAEILVALSTVNPPAAPAATVKAPAKTPAKPRPITVASLNAAAGKRTAK